MSRKIKFELHTDTVIKLKELCEIYHLLDIVSCWVINHATALPVHGTA